jgi:GT2 family glycosyltransferase
MNALSHARVSVVIPTHRRHRPLRRCLEGLCAQKYPAGLIDVIVVNDGGPPLPDDLLSGISSCLRVRLVHQENTGPGGARNRGAREANHELLAFLDDDCVPEPGWLAALSPAVLSMPEKVFAGETVNGLVANPFSSTSQLLNEYIISSGKTGEGEVSFVPSSNLAMAKRIYQECGGFHEGFRLAAGEDRDFCRRLASRGYAIRVLEHARVVHFHELTMRSFIRQQHNYGRGAYLYRLRQSRAKDGKIALEGGTFYMRLFLHAVAYAFTTRSYSVPLLTLASQVAVALGFLRESMHGSELR